MGICSCLLDLQANLAQAFVFRKVLFLSYIVVRQVLSGEGAWSRCESGSLGSSLKCHFPSRKRPWHRRAVAWTRKTSSAALSFVLQRPGWHLLVFNHLHLDSITYRYFQRITNTDQIKHARNAVLCVRWCPRAVKYSLLPPGGLKSGYERAIPRPADGQYLPPWPVDCTLPRRADGIPPPKTQPSKNKEAQLHACLERAADAMHKGELADAAKALRQALTIDPHSLAALNNLGIVLSREGKPGRSDSSLRKGAEGSP